MVQTSKEMQVVVGDMIDFIPLKEPTTTYKGIVTYNFNHDVLVLTETEWFKFEDIKYWKILETGPFHNFVCNDK